MLPHIHPPIMSLLILAPYIHTTFSFCHVAAYNNTVYTRHISILSCPRVYTLLLYAAHFHLIMSPRIHPLIIRGRLWICDGLGLTLTLSQNRPPQNSI